MRLLFKARFIKVHYIIFVTPFKTIFHDHVPRMIRELMSGHPDPGLGDGLIDYQNSKGRESGREEGNMKKSVGIDH